MTDQTLGTFSYAKIYDFAWVHDMEFSFVHALCVEIVVFCLDLNLRAYKCFAAVLKD